MIAHKREDGQEQSIQEHLEGTAALARAFSDAFGAGDFGELVGLAHDIGKYSDEFQRRIRSHGPKVDHASAGAFECAKFGLPPAFCVAGHHSGLPDLGGRDDLEEGTLHGRYNRAKKGLIPDCQAWKTEIALPKPSNPFQDSPGRLSVGFFTRMLFSCLVDADFLDTEQFMRPDIKRDSPNSDMQTLCARLDQFIAPWLNPQGMLNKKRSEILQACIQQAPQKQGVFSLTVPTGGGKTVSSLAFALHHALANSLHRVIYVVPYTSIIEQTADVFRKILGSENILEHHSGVVFDDDENPDNTATQMRLATENWDMPVIITTAVQFFESLYASRTSACRKLHNIAQSVVVFDEAQMLPTPYLRPCVFAIAELVRRYQVSAVLCTATQPSLNELFRSFCPEINIREICPAALSHAEVFRRTTIRSAGLLRWEEIAEKMNQTNQILCIVNSRKAAQTVFSSLSPEGRYHLSTLMTPYHRREKLNEIRALLQDGKPCKVVATSLIEAGVDIDFPEVLREEAGLDSIMQAAGRCNREGKRDPDNSVVTVFRPETPAPSLFGTNIAAERTALRVSNDVFDETAIRTYFDELLALKGDEALDQRQILRQMEKSFAFRTVAEQFRLIGDETKTVYIPFGDGAALLQQLLDGQTSRSLFRKLSLYGVDLYPRQIESMLNAGSIQPAGSNSWFLADLSLYDSERGLSITEEFGNALFL